jgi:hypothetical protein
LKRGYDDGAVDQDVVDRYADVGVIMELVGYGESGPAVDGDCAVCDSPSVASKGISHVSSGAHPPRSLSTPNPTFDGNSTDRLPTPTPIDPLGLGSSSHNSTSPTAASPSLMSPAFLAKVTKSASWGWARDESVSDVRRVRWACEWEELRWCV